MNQSQDNSTTSCRDCCFADYEGREQIGCLVRPMDEDSFFYSSDEERDYRIFRRMCHFKREEGKWCPDKDMDDKIDILDEEVKIKYNVFIETSPIYDNFGQALLTFNRQTLQPQKIVGVDFSGQTEINFNIMKMSGLKARWSHQEFLDTPADWRDNVMVQHKSQFYVFIKPPIILPNDFFEVLSDRINYQDLRFGCVQEENMLIFPNGLYQLRPLPLREILQEIEVLGLQKLRYEDSYSAVTR